MIAPDSDALKDSFGPLGLGWRAVLCSRTVRLTVRRLRRDAGVLKGYLDVEYKAPGTPRSAPSDRLAGEVINISSGRERVSFANRLSERKKDIDWRNIIDAFCVQVEQGEEEREPMTWVGNLPRPIDGGFLIDGLLERNQNNSIHGDGAVGKSFLALAACISVTTGLEVIPGYKPMARGPALYCDNETDQDTMNYRVQQIARGLGIEPPNIGYLRMDRAFADETERIAEMIQQYGFLLTVIDSVEAAMAGSTSHGASQLDGPSRLNRSIRRIGPVTTLLIDHINAEQSDSDGVIRRPYGSIFKRNWVRRSFHLKQATEAVDGYRHLGLFIAKVNNAAEPPPVGLRWAINDETCTWDRENLDEPELTSALPVVERIARYLTLFGPSPPASIGEYTGISTSTIRSILMRRPGVFVRDPIKGLWDNVIDSDVSSMDDRYIANDDDVGDLP